MKSLLGLFVISGCSKSCVRMKEIDPKLGDNKKALLLAAIIGVSFTFFIRYFLFYLQ